MNSNSSFNNSSISSTTRSTALDFKPLNGADIAIRGGFEAKSFRASDIGAAMDPLVLVDHYVMTGPTFGIHPHAGLSAVSLIFSDSEGRFHNRDSLGSDFDLLPGDLYWLKAGSGALHDETPREQSRIHGLQLFINIPQECRHEEPASLLVRGHDMPVINNDEHTVRVALGESNGVVGAASPALPMTILDGQVIHNGRFEHHLQGGRNAWVHAIDNDVEIMVLGHSTKLRKGQAMAIENADKSESVSIRVSGSELSGAHFVLLDGQAIKEPFVQQGPFVGRTTEEVATFKHAFEHNQFGSIEPSK